MTRAYIAYIPRMYRARIYPVPHIEIYARPSPRIPTSRATQISAQRKAGGKMRVTGPFG
jgi:hypothetical protein